MRSRLWLSTLTAVFLTVISCSKSSKNPTQPNGGGGGNHAPVLSVSADSSRMTAGNLCTVRVTASDVDGDPVTIAYTAAGGSVTSSGPTATTATFTASRVGNDSVSVSATDGHGGAAAALALIYVVRSGTPSLPGIKYTCAWQATPNESLTVVDGWAGGPSATHNINVDGHALPSLVPAGNSAFVQSVDPCTETLTIFHILVQRPLPDGRTYEVVVP